MTDFQKLALKQLEEISNLSENHIEIIEIVERNEYLNIEISILCKYIIFTEGGLVLHERERFIISIGPEFPFIHPTVVTPHIRFAYTPHVQWKRILCLYQSPNTEWNAERGIFGLIDRLYDWLTQAAANNLDPVEAPMHPPVAYKPDKNLPIIIPSVNCPEFEDNVWFGFAKLKEINDKSIIITEWLDSSNFQKKQNVAFVLLLSKPMPFEFPRSFEHLIFELEQRGIDIKSVFSQMMDACMLNGAGKPLYIIIGTPMRGTADNRKQHLSAWHLSEEQCRNLRVLSSRKPGKQRDQHFDNFLNWAKKSELDWCEIRELRNEVIEPRDKSSVLNWFKNKTVSLWGCGALGSSIAELLVRAGVKKLILRDTGKVVPGILVRQNFIEEQIGLTKVKALEESLMKIRNIINPVEIQISEENILYNPLDNEIIYNDEDIIVDTTGSEAVIKKLEYKISKTIKPIPIVSMVIGHNAMNGFVVLSNSKSDGGPLRVIRKAKLEICNDKEFQYYADEFFPKVPRGKPFQPEPGCSEPTFTGSYSDIIALSSSMLNLISDDLINQIQSTSRAHFIKQFIKDNNRKPLLGKSISIDVNEQILNEKLMGYKAVISKKAYESIIKTVNKSKKKLRKTSETGGLLFGDWDDLTKVVYIDEASSPPPDSKSSPSEFICGIKGTKEKNEELKKLSRGSTSFVGYWHSHPYASSEYSGKDNNCMIIVAKELSPPKSLMIIIGFDDHNFDFGAYIFHKDHFKTKYE